MSRVELSGFTAFVEAVLRAGLRAVVLRVVSEVRPRVHEEHRVEVGMQRWAELLAYHGGTILVARVEDADGDALEDALVAAGLTVRRVSGNIT
jgi:hypothetical protein